MLAALKQPISREVLPEKLVWAPEQEGIASVQSMGHVLSALDLCSVNAQRGEAGSKYGVRHYSVEACGIAFGPLGFESLLRFCRGLDAELQGMQSGTPVVLTTPKQDHKARMNAAVLLGCYLVIKHDFSVSSVAAKLGNEGGQKYPSAWNNDENKQDKVLTVADCWHGAKLARDLGWVNPKVVEDNGLTNAMCESYVSISTMYDATWMIPGMLMVSADPTTVTCDPNPATCKRLLPGRADGAASATAAGGTELENCEADSVANSVADSIADSVDTVCKDFDSDRHHDNCPSASQMSSLPSDFATFFQQSGIQRINRANFDWEPGMKERSYSSKLFSPHGISTLNLRIKDTNGGLPTPQDVQTLLDANQDFMLTNQGSSSSNAAILIHCKGGFGRSVVLATCLVVERLDVPGLAVIGWFRIMRPGAMTNSKQEVFLRKLRGRCDVQTFTAGGKNALFTTSCVGCNVM